MHMAVVKSRAGSIDFFRRGVENSGSLHFDLDKIFVDESLIYSASEKKQRDIVASPE
jgi:hypothetical protein